MPLQTGVSVRTSPRTESFAAGPIAGFLRFFCPELGRVLTAAIGGFRRFSCPRCWADRITFSSGNFRLFQSRKPVTARLSPAQQGLHSVCKPISWVPCLGTSQTQQSPHNSGPWVASPMGDKAVNQSPLARRSIPRRCQNPAIAATSALSSSCV